MFVCAGDAEAKRICAKLGQQPRNRGVACAWWDKPWLDEESDISQMRTATSDELGDEVVSMAVSDMEVEPAVNHPSVAANMVEAEIEQCAQTSKDPVERTPVQHDGMEYVSGSDEEIEEIDAPGEDAIPPGGPPQIFNGPRANGK